MKIEQSDRAAIALPAGQRAAMRPGSRGPRARTMLIIGALAIAVLFLADGCASTSTKPEYIEFPSNQTLEGGGGELSLQDGIDIWKGGAPLQEYRIIGIIQIPPQELEHSEGSFAGHLNELWRGPGIDSQLAKIAKAHGGDAVVIARQDQLSGNPQALADQTPDDSGTPGSGQHSRLSTVYVIKYVQ